MVKSKLARYIQLGHLWALMQFLPTERYQSTSTTFQSVSFRYGEETPKSLIAQGQREQYHRGTKGRL